MKHLPLSSWLVLMGALGVVAEAEEKRSSLLSGVVDLHVHAAPDVMPRSVDSIAAARQAQLAGMRALVLKSHVTSTADRAEMVAAEVPGIEVYGGIVLNRAVGGLNLAAIEAMVATQGGRGRIVWMPTIDAVRLDSDGRPVDGGIVTVVDGAVTPDARAVLVLIAQHGLVLATGHTPRAHLLPLVRAARELGIERIVITHALSYPVRQTAEDLRPLIALGAKVELVHLVHLDESVPRPLRTVTLDTTANLARELGPENVVLSSDLGRSGYPTPVDGLRTFAQHMVDHGFTSEEVDLMFRTNPARLLGLGP